MTLQTTPVETLVPPRSKFSFFNVILRLISYTLLGAALAFACVAIIIPKVAGAIPVTILSDSMAPTMPVGSLAIIRPNSALDQAALTTRSPEEIRNASDYSTLSNGDIVAYQPDPKNPTLIIHRIVRMTAHGDGSMEYITKGDNNNTEDRDPVFDFQIRGTVWYHLPPPIGTINTWLNHDTTNHMIAIIIIAAVGYFWALMQFIVPARARRRALRDVRASIADAPTATPETNTAEE
ncbi:signal peptidase I [Leucobacter sp. UT-8R-CII-1-4]|uniref:signal peptidase I n=1 Tax=Leucobacter sp. UT-8R-CII-1-4 TaxID=3040075 RepID=UPI0024A9EADC|nr:signal peptidase I [Leucobacter sp. UT-8R-CII-1-4]MDI6022813.1 signal peptidase I [Leucobacter sp. UT-8R-CII-1-4]